jgi:hypothetical protein
MSDLAEHLNWTNDKGEPLKGLHLVLAWCASGEDRLAELSDCGKS